MAPLSSYRSPWDGFARTLLRRQLSSKNGSHLVQTRYSCCTGTARCRNGCVGGRRSRPQRGVADVALRCHSDEHIVASLACRLRAASVPTLIANGVTLAVQATRNSTSIAVAARGDLAPDRSMALIGGRPRCVLCPTIVPSSPET